MAFELGTTDINKVYLGSSEINKVYLGSTVVYQPTSGSTLLNGLHAYYNCNSGATDSSGNGRDGTVTGATLTTGNGGLIGEAYDYDGANDFIDTGTFIDVTGDYSMSCWFKVDNTSTNKVLITQDVTTNAKRPSLFVLGGSLVFRQEDDAGTNQDIVIGGILVGIWYHAVATYNHTTGVMSLHRNDGTPSTLTITKPTSTLTNRWTIGYNPANSFGPMNGLIDEVGLWERVLTSAEITELYNGGSGFDPTA